MAIVPSDARAQLIERKERLEDLVARSGRVRQVEDLLRDIDDALARMSAGSYGLCETCHDPIEPERLEVDPLIRFCLDHLSPSQARALEQDLELASRVQLNLLPPSELTLDGWQMSYHYQPLGTVSGDYVDIVRPGDGNPDTFFLFGDIAGKGVAASMLMAHLHASVRTLITLGLPMPQVMERANRLFCESTMANHYATLVGGRLSARGQLKICNAGHCPPIHLHQGEAFMLDPTSVPVGLFCQKEYPERQVDLAPGDSLVLYTDGVTETFGAGDQEYGMDRLVAVARANAAGPASSLVSACIADVDAFRAGIRRTDDVTLMVIRRL